MKNNELIEEAEEYLFTHIPITVHLGVRVLSYDGRSIEIHAPLDPNINHRETAFGGSLSAVAILSGWALIHLALLEEDVDARLVIQKSSMDFIKAVEGAFMAECSLPGEEEWQRFLTMLNRKSVARLNLKSTVTCNGEMVCTHDGTYVAMIKEPER